MELDHGIIISIYDAITSIIEEKGLSAVTLSSVADRCYVHKTAVLYYFDNKTDLLIHYFRYMQEKMDYSIPKLYEGCNPVAVFCDFIDNRIEKAKQSLPFLRAKYQFLLISDPKDSSLIQFTIGAAKTQFELIEPFINIGIIEEERLHEGMALWYAFASGLRFQELFGQQPRYIDYIEHEGKEKLKRIFLKDNLYDQYLDSINLTDEKSD